MTIPLASPSVSVWPAPADQPPPQLERARGSARVTLRADGGTTRLAENYQSGATKVRFPYRLAGGPVEAVLLNTAGGVTGGDRLSYAVSVGAGARGIATTQAVERIYRRSAGTARIETTLRVGADGALDWLPQETIVFDNSAFSRSLVADVDPDGRLLAVEAIVLGRAAMGEAARNIAATDTWRIRRGGRLVFADGLRLDGDSTGILAGTATGGGAAAMATLVLVAPDAETHIDTARTVIASCRGDVGASAWSGMLVARLLAPTGQMLRGDLMRSIEALRGIPMPRVWHC
jgi:urease accessory protein